MGQDIEKSIRARRHIQMQATHVHTQQMIASSCLGDDQGRQSMLTIHGLTVMACGALPDVQ